MAAFVLLLGRRLLNAMGQSMRGWQYGWRWRRQRQLLDGTRCCLWRRSMGMVVLLGVGMGVGVFLKRRGVHESRALCMLIARRLKRRIGPWRWQSILLKMYRQRVRQGRRWWWRRPVQRILLLVDVVGVERLKLGQDMVVRVEGPIRRLVERLKSSRVQRPELLLQGRRRGLLHDGAPVLDAALAPSRRVGESDPR